MACLKKNGQELARMSITVYSKDPESATEWNRHEYALMSNNKILSKKTVLFRPTPLKDKGELHTWGWKVWDRLETGLNADDFARIYEKNGFTRTK